jgi:hypothetical protein
MIFTISCLTACGDFIFGDLTAPASAAANVLKMRLVKLAQITLRIAVDCTPLLEGGLHHGVVCNNFFVWH